MSWGDESSHRPSPPFRNLDYENEPGRRLAAKLLSKDAARRNAVLFSLRISTGSNIAPPLDQQHGDEDLPPCCCRLRYGSTLVKPPPTPTPMVLEKPLVVAEPLPIEAALLTALL
jgi:hypothetical protein